MKKRKWLYGVAMLFLCAGGLWKIIPKMMEQKISQRLDLVEVVCAAHTLTQRTVIQESDVKIIEIPSAYLNQSAYQTKEEVLGKVTVHEGFIPEGSLFYYDALEDVSEISDAALLGLQEDQVLFALETNIVALAANALLEGQIVDMYVTMDDDHKDTVTGLILENVRILGIKDHKGLNLDHPDSTGSPHVIQFAVSKEALAILQKARHVGEITYYASGVSYEQLDECIVAWEGEILELLGFEKEKAIEG